MKVNITYSRIAAGELNSKVYAVLCLRKHSPFAMEFSDFPTWAARRYWTEVLDGWWPDYYGRVSYGTECFCIGHAVEPDADLRTFRIIASQTARRLFGPDGILGRRMYAIVYYRVMEGERGRGEPSRCYAYLFVSPYLIDMDITRGLGRDDVPAILRTARRCAEESDAELGWIDMKRMLVRNDDSWTRPEATDRSLPDLGEVDLAPLQDPDLPELVYYGWDIAMGRDRIGDLGPGREDHRWRYSNL